jgi:phospholipid transport system substrate-binding protein
MFVDRSKIGLKGKRFISETLILVVFLCLWGSGAIAAESPQAVVQTGTEQVLRILNQYPEDTRARRELIQGVIDGYFDFEAISRLAVGPRWRSMPPEKQQEFTQEFKMLLFNTYIGDLQEYAKAKITYKNRSIYPGYAVVEEVINDQGGPVTLGYYLHVKDGVWKVYDVAVEGMSLVSNYRDQFDSVLARGSFNGLFVMLRQKLAQVCATNRC